MSEITIYSDVNQVTPQKKALLTNIESIYQSINNILATNKGERVFNPEFGSNLENLLFEPIDNITALKVFTFLTNAIERFEPRVTINYGRTTVTPDVSNQSYELLLVFNVKSTGEEQEFIGELIR